MVFGCGVTLVRELSSGRCNSSISYGCADRHVDGGTTGSRLFYVRNGCVGIFSCNHRGSRDVIEPDKTRTCGSGKLDVEHECDCRWSLPLVVPLHPPRYAYGCNLFLSIVRPPGLERYSLGRGRLRFVPVFSSQADLNNFARLYGQTSVGHGMLVPPHASL